MKSYYSLTQLGGKSLKRNDEAWHKKRKKDLYKNKKFEDGNDKGKLLSSLKKGEEYYLGFDSWDQWANLDDN